MNILPAKSFRIIVVALFFAVVTVIFCFPLIHDFDLLGRGDWDQQFFYHDSAQITILSYGQFPFWNPYYCGGMTLIGNPQTRFLSPSLIYTLPLGVVKGLKVELMVHVFLGMLGMYFLSRRYKIDPVVALLPGIIFMLNSAVILHLTEGHLWLMSVAYLPFIFLFYLKSFEKSKYIFLSALFLTLILYEGGIYILQFSIIMIGVFAVFSAIQRRSFKPMILSGVLFILFALYASPKLLPMLELILQYPRSTGLGGVRILHYLGEIYLSRSQSMYRVFEPAPPQGWWNYGAYIGVVPFILFAGSLTLIKKHWPLILSGLFLFLISLDHFMPYSPWSFLHNLPVFNNMHVVSRARVFFVFALALLAGLYFQVIVNRLQRKKIFQIIFASLIVGIVFVDLTLVGSRVLKEASRPFFLNGKVCINLRNPSVKNRDKFLQIFVPMQDRQKYGAWSIMHHTLLQNLGDINGYESIPVQRSAIAHGSPDYKGEYYLKEGKGKVAQVYWSPNKLAYKFDLQDADKLVINQNYDKYWKTNPPRPVSSQDGLLSIELAPDDRKLIVYYSPTSFFIGLGFLWLGIVIFVFWERIARSFKLDGGSR